jgi:ribosomal protein S18 acetylase RimI-like enzyme
MISSLASWLGLRHEQHDQDIASVHIRDIATPSGKTTGAGAGARADEFLSCVAVDAECFPAGLQHGGTSLADLRRMHSPPDGKFILVCCSVRSSTGIGDGSSPPLPPPPLPPAGEVVLGFVAFSLRDESAHVLTLAVAHRARRRGGATALLQGVLEAARRNRLWQCHLEVGGTGGMYV